MDAHAISSTIHALNPVDSAYAFRAVVLAWLAVASVALVAVRPLLLDAVDLLWAVRRAWEEQGKDGTHDKQA